LISTPSILSVSFVSMTFLPLTTSTILSASTTTLPLMVTPLAAMLGTKARVLRRSAVQSPLARERAGRQSSFVTGSSNMATAATTAEGQQLFLGGQLLILGVRKLFLGGKKSLFGG